jgi:hypothetical protein
VQPGEGGGQSLVVSCQAAAAGHPAEGSFDHPSARQQHEAAFGFRQFDHFQLDVLLLGCFGGPITGVTLIDIRQFNRFIRDLLHVTCQFAYLIAVLLIGRRDTQREQMPQRVHGDVHL